MGADQAPSLAERIAAIESAPNRFPQALRESLGFSRVLLLDESGHARVQFEAREAFTHSGGTTVQGGILGAWVDNAMAWAIWARDANSGIATLELKISYLGRVGQGPCIADARVVRWGGRVVFLEASLEQPEGQILVRASSTAMRLG